MTDSADTSRRGFLATVAAFTVVTLAPGVTLRVSAQEPTQPGKRPARWGILIDTGACTPDCTACVAACATEFGLTSFGRPLTDPQWIRKVTVTDPSTGFTRSFPVMCQHCGDPPCVDVCPTRASFKRFDGIVVVDRHICIGCRYCIMACPYDARNFVAENIVGQTPYAPRGIGTAEACNMCVHRIDVGGTPACVEACSTDGRKAMLFGDINDPNSEISKRAATYGAMRIRADLHTDPAVRYQGGF
jgi:molybdopterin-containing oxidoreductase family iron-sulfur binding subunit